MKTFLLLAAATTTTLVTTETPEKERYKAIAPYFMPAPGSEITVNQVAVRDRKTQDPLMLRGSIMVKPPKGVCFTITRNPEYPDDKICKPTELTFKLKDLSPAGKLVWRVRTGPKDFGNDYVWPSPHRLAQVIPAGEKPGSGFTNVGINKCTAYAANPERREIILELTSGLRWRITFPPKDVMLEQPASMPNLYVDRGGGKGPAREEVDAEGPEYKPPTVVKGKATDPVTKFWAMPVRKSFTMNASNFKSSDTTPGMKGSCRYQFKDAPGDVESGWIECHDTDYFDVVYTYLPCSKILITN